MLKTTKDGAVWLVTQPDHGELAGYLAAHWGNAVFTRPGSHASGPASERLRAAWVFAVAQHDNGWWEWEAQPDVAAAGGLPLGLAEVLADQQAGMERWRRGLRRFPRAPFSSLLISHHAHWLYAARALSDPDPAFNHPLFWQGAPEQLYPGSLAAPLAFSTKSPSCSSPGGKKCAPTQSPPRGSSRPACGHSCACCSCVTVSRLRSARRSCRPARVRPGASARTPLSYATRRGAAGMTV